MFTIVRQSIMHINQVPAVKVKVTHGGQSLDKNMKMYRNHLVILN
jgi:hypothetical protein